MRSQAFSCTFIACPFHRTWCHVSARQHTNTIHSWPTYYHAAACKDIQYGVIPTLFNDFKAVQEWRSTCTSGPINSQGLYPIPSLRGCCPYHSFKSWSKAITPTGDPTCVQFQQVLFHRRRFWKKSQSLCPFKSFIHFRTVLQTACSFCHLPWLHWRSAMVEQCCDSVSVCFQTRDTINTLILVKAECL